MLLRGMQGCNRFNTLSALKRFFLAMAVLLSTGLTTPAFAAPAAFYVSSTSGNNSYNGTSWGSAWATVQYAASNAVPNAEGAIIYISPGVYTSTATITPAYSGASSAPIIYQGTATSTQNPVILNSGFSLSNLNYIEIKSLSIENITGADAIFLNGSNYITIDTVSIANIFTSGTSGGYGIRAYGCSDLSVQNCYTYETEQSGIADWGLPYGENPGAGGSATYPSQYVNIRNNVVDRACDGGTNECIDIANGVEYANVEFNTVMDSTPLAPGANLNGGEGIDVKLSAWNVNIDHNQIFNIGRQGMQLDGGAYADSPGAEGIHHIYVFDNVIHDIPACGINIEAENWDGSLVGPDDTIEVVNNLIYNNASDGVCVLNFQNPSTKTYSDQPVTNILIANNTIWNNNTGYRNQNFSGSGGIDVAYPSPALDPSDILVLNNLVGGSSNNAYYQDWKYAIAAQYNGNNPYWGCATVQNNVVDSNENESSGKLDNETWLASLNSTYDINNQVVTSLGLKNVTTAPYDFHLTSGSAAIGAGVFIQSTDSSTWPYSPYGAWDFASEARPTSGSWDAGAYNASDTDSFLFDGVYSLTGNDSNLTLDDPAGALEGTQIDQYDYLDNANEKWLVKNQPNSGYTDWTGYNTLSVMIPNSGCVYPMYAGVNGTPVDLENYSSSNSDQQWSAIAGSSGYQFVNEESGLYLDVYNDKTVNNTPIVQNSSGQSGENFTLTPLSGGAYALIVALGTIPNINPVLTDVRNNFPGWIGYKFTVPSSADPNARPITVTYLGRWVYEDSNPEYFNYDDSETHEVALFDSNGNMLSGGEVTVDCNAWVTAGNPEGFDYVQLSTPIQLIPGDTYFLASQETNGGDPWYNDTTTFAPAWGTVVNSAYSSSSSGPYSFLAGLSGDSSYGPVDFWYY